MNSFSLPELQRIVDVYRIYVGVRRVGLHLDPNCTATARALMHPRKIKLHPKALKLSRRAQIVLIIHELCHYKTPKAKHSKSWKNNAYLWCSAFQIRHVMSDESVKKHIVGGCDALDTYSRCDECPA